MNTALDFYKTLYGTISNSSRDAYVYSGERHSYADMHREMTCINSALSGISKKRIALFARKGFSTYNALFAILLSGNTWIPVNPDIPEARNLDMIRLAEPELILIGDELSPEIAEYAAAKDCEVITLEDLISAGEETEFIFEDFAEDDVAVIFFTSGSTGLPKGVPMTHGNYIPTVRNILHILPYQKGEVFGDYHDLGFVLSVGYLFTCVLTESAFCPAIEDVERMAPIAHLIRNKITVLVTVPSTMARIRTMKRDGIDDHSLRIICLAGEPLHLDILEYCFDKLGVDNVFDFYGSTEVGCWIFHHPCSRDDLDKYGDLGTVPIGRPLAGNEVRLSEQGELQISGPQVTPGYLSGENTEKFLEIDDKCWFAMGDKVLERDGVYICKGRLDSQVKIDGYRIELMDTEAHLRNLDGVDQAVCFVTQVGGHDAIVAGLVGNRECQIQEVREQMKEKLPSYMIPRKVFLIEKIPLNKSGKIDRIAVQANYENMAKA
jgi:acyl-coenzyme A synthetase/AMP-(fatty) acid ligase